MLGIVVFIILVVVGFAPPFWFGHIGAPFWTSLLWSVLMSAEVVFFSGWRAPRGGVIGSFAFGTLIAAVMWCVPTYWLGRLI